MCVASNAYASETWTITKALEQQLAAAQRNMERAMIGVSWHDHRTNEWVRRKTMVCNIMHVTKARKLTWASHIARIQDNRWTSQVFDEEVHPRRDGGMKSMTSGDLLHGSKMAKTDCHGKGMLRLTSNTWIDNGLI